MEKVRPWCSQPSDCCRLNRTEWWVLMVAVTRWMKSPSRLDQRALAPSSHHVLSWHSSAWTLAMAMSWRQYHRHKNGYLSSLLGYNTVTASDRGLLRQTECCGLFTGLYVCLSVGHVREPGTNRWTYQDGVWGGGKSSGPRNHILDGFQIPQEEKAIFRSSPPHWKSFCWESVVHAKKRLSWSKCFWRADSCLSHEACIIWRVKVGQIHSPPREVTSWQFRHTGKHCKNG